MQYAQATRHRSYVVSPQGGERGDDLLDPLPRRRRRAPVCGAPRTPTPKVDEGEGARSAERASGRRRPRRLPTPDRHDAGRSRPRVGRHLSVSKRLKRSTTAATAASSTCT